MSDMLKAIQDKLKQNATAAGKRASGKFVPGSERVYGVRLPVINALAKEYKAGGFDLAEQLWISGSFEEKLLAAKLIGKVCKKDPERALGLVRKFAGQIADWAVCDTLGMQSLKPVAKIIREETFELAEELVSSANLWERRLSLVLVEAYAKDRSQQPRIRRIMHKLRHDKEYYVQKAVAWTERNLKKYSAKGTL